MTAPAVGRMAHIAVEARAWLLLLATIVVSALAVPSFFTVPTMATILDTNASIGIIAIGMTVLLVAGQIDLSVGPVMALGGIVAIKLQSAVPTEVALIAGIAAGAACGMLNGLIVTRLQINGLIATLATMLGLQSVAYIIAPNPVSGTDISLSLRATQTYLSLLTPRTILFLVMVITLQLWLSRTVPGRNLFAIGSRASSAAASGIQVNRYLTLAYAFSGTCAAVAGVAQSISVNSASPVEGSSVLIPVITAVVIGGTRLEGGRGSAFGTLAGVLTLGTAVVAMSYVNIQDYVQSTVIGAALVVLVISDRLPRLFSRHRAGISKA